MLMGRPCTAGRLASPDDEQRIQATCRVVKKASAFAQACAHTAAATQGPTRADL